MEFHEWLFGPEKFSGLSRNGLQACVSHKPRKLYGHEKPFVKHRRAYSVKLVVSNVVKEIQIKITAKFRDTEHLRFEDKKRIMSPEKFRDFRERGSRSLWIPDFKSKKFSDSVIQIALH